MKKTILLATTVCISTLALAQNNRAVIVNRTPAAFTPRPGIPFRKIEMAEARNNGQPMKPTDKIKTISGKEITLEDYLTRVNKIEQEISKKGYTLRNYELPATSLKFKPVLMADAEIQRTNLQINSGKKAPLGKQQRFNFLLDRKKKSTTPKAGSSSQKSAAGNAVLNNPNRVKIGNNIELKKQEKTIVADHSIKELLKPLTDRIQESITNEGATLNIPAASLKVTSFAQKPFIGELEDGINGTESEYKVAVNFNANITGSYGLPFSITIPMATMTGEFTARANSTKQHERKVVVNLMGRSFFNKTTAISSETYSENDEDELQLTELLATKAFSSMSFMDWIPSVGINTSFNLGGSVGCAYQVDLDRNGVTAFIGPTYGTTLRVAASFGLEDVLEGGIEGIVTLVKGGLGFGGTAGLAKEEGVWRLQNLSTVEATLEALKGEINLFVRYPDMSNWSCWGPCIKKQTLPLYETPTAFRLNGTLLEEDKGVNLNWQ